MLDAFDRFWLDPEDVRTTLWYYEHNQPCEFCGAGGGGENVHEESCAKANPDNANNDSDSWYSEDGSSYSSWSGEEEDSDDEHGRRGGSDGEEEEDEDEEKSNVDDNVETVVIDKMEYLMDRRTREVFAYDVQSPMFVGLMRQDGSLQRAPPGPAALAMMSDPDRRGPVLPDPTLVHIRGAAAASSLDAQALSAVFWEAQRSLAQLPEHIERLPLAGGGRVYHNTRTGEVSHRHPIHDKYVALLQASSSATIPPTAVSAATASEGEGCAEQTAAAGGTGSYSSMAEHSGAAAPTSAATPAATGKGKHAPAPELQQQQQQQQQGTGDSESGKQ